jgi:LysW-gamma-L-lysine carboxypeptidase
MQKVPYQHLLMQCLIIPDFNPDYLIVGEPNRWDRIALGYKGNAWTRIVFNQEKSHTASFLKSACENAIDAWEKLRIWIDNYNGEKNKLFDQIQATLRNWSSGDDGFQEWATLDIGVRLPMSFTADDWYETIPMLIPEGDIHPLGMTVNAYTCEKNTPIVRAFLHGIRENQGVPGFVYKTGTSDLNVVAPHWGCPAVVYGPGDSKLDHTPNEHISLEEYQKSVKILSSTFSYLMSST